MSSVGRSAATNTVQEAVVSLKEIRGTTAAALVAAWAVDERDDLLYSLIPCKRIKEVILDSWIRFF